MPTETWIPPDGGYGWVVALASMGLNFIYCFGNGAFGVLYVAFMEVFDMNKSQGALLMVCQLIVYTVLGKSFLYIW